MFKFYGILKGRGQTGFQGHSADTLLATSLPPIPVPELV